MLLRRLFRRPKPPPIDRRQVFRLRLPAWRVRAVAWLCKARNTVFHIQHFSPFRSNLLEEVMARTVCC